MKYLGHFYISEDANEWAEHLSAIFFEKLQKYNQQEYNVALSGGSTPLPFYQKLSEVAKSNSKYYDIATKTNLFLVDERYVPSDNDASNSKKINQIFNDSPFHLNLPDKNNQLKIDSYNYDTLLRKSIPLSKEEVPIFDIMILGMGNDGHTASLFPKSDALNEKKRFFIENIVEDHFPERMTMTYPIIIEAKLRWILCKGEKKIHTITDLMKDKSFFPIGEIFNNKDLKNEWFVLNENE